MNDTHDSNHAKSFFPSGAIFFFALLLLLYASLWLVIYWLMIERS